MTHRKITIAFSSHAQLHRKKCLLLSRVKILKTSQPCSTSVNNSEFIYYRQTSHCTVLVSHQGLTEFVFQNCVKSMLIKRGGGQGSQSGIRREVGNSLESSELFANQKGEGMTMGGQKGALKRDRRKQATPVRRGHLHLHLIPKLPFLKLVKQIAMHVRSNSMQGFRYITKGFI